MLAYRQLISLSLIVGRNGADEAQDRAHIRFHQRGGRISYYWHDFTPLSCSRSRFLRFDSYSTS